MCFTKTNKQILDSLDRPLDLGNNDEPLWSDKCDYLDPSNCTDLNPENYNLVVMQLNITPNRTKRTSPDNVKQEFYSGCHPTL